MKHILKQLCFVACLMFVFQRQVHAYIDPSTTTYLIQVVVGIFIAGGVVIGVFRHKIKRLFVKKDSNAPASNASADESNAQNNEDMFD